MSELVQLPTTATKQERESWPFSTLLPWSVMYNYPPPQLMPDIAAPKPGAWPPPIDKDAARWRAETEALGAPINQLYIHVPFCPFICDFCPFYKTKDPGLDTKESYVRSLLEEIAFYARDERIASRPYGVIYFGGGTPTELSAEQIARIMRALKSGFNLTPDVEITLEGVAKQMLQPGYLEQCFELGVNRLSFGIQSLDPAVRAAIGRTGEELDEYPAAIEHARRIKADVPVNIELLHGCPEQTNESLARDLERCISWSPASIDLFSYIMMPSTPLYQKVLQGKVPQPRYGKTLLEQRRIGKELLENAGYKQVAGEMFKKTDRGAFSHSFYGGSGNAMHTVLALGPSAIGHADGTAYRNIANLKRYQESLAEGMLPIESAVTMTRAQARRRALLLAVAHLEVPRVLVQNRQEKKCFARWEKEGLVEAHELGWKVTREGTIWYNQMQMELLPVWDLVRNASLLGSIEEQDRLINSGSPLGQELMAMAAEYGGLPSTLTVMAYKTMLRAAKHLPGSWTRGAGWLGPAKRIHPQS